MPFKVWAVGEEVLAADFNAYMQQQVVAVFANAAARDAAIVAPVVGQFALTTDIGVLTRWNGTAWVPAGSTPYYNARATRAAAYTIPTALGGVIVMDTKVFDPSNSFNTTTGAYTCKAAGTYLAKTQISATLGAAYTLNAHVAKNGASDAQVNGYQANGALILAVTTLLICAVGDTLDPRTHTNVASVALRANPNETHFFVAYLGP